MGIVLTLKQVRLIEQDCIDTATVNSAIKQLASEYRRVLEPEDDGLLAEIDGGRLHAGNDERTRMNHKLNFPAGLSAVIAAALCKCLKDIRLSKNIRACTGPDGVN